MPPPALSSHWEDSADSPVGDGAPGPAHDAGQAAKMCVETARPIHAGGLPRDIAVDEARRQG